MAERIIGHLPGIPSDMLTSTQPEVRRLQVDVSQTGFWAGREFRAFKEFVIGATPLIIRAVIPSSIKGIIVHSLTLSCYQGGVHLRSWRAGTVGGSWTPITPRANNEIPDVAGYTSVVTLEEGGTLTNPSLQGDVVTAFANESGKSSTTTALGIAGERGLAPATIYLELARVAGVSVDSLGDMKVLWEERAIDDPWVLEA
jgi:hypothetical protein